MELNTSWASAIAEIEIAPAVDFPATKSAAARAVRLHNGAEMDAQAAFESRAAASAAADKTTPRRVNPRRSLSHARANRLRTVPAGHLSRSAASSGVRPFEIAEHDR